MQTAGLQSAVAVKVLPESKELLVPKRKEWPAEGGKHSQLIIRAFDRGESIAESDDFLAIVERAPAYQNMRNTTDFQRSDVGPCNIGSECAQPAEQYDKVPWPDGDSA